MATDECHFPSRSGSIASFQALCRDKSFEESFKHPTLRTALGPPRTPGASRHHPGARKGEGNCYNHNSCYCPTIPLACGHSVPAASLETLNCCVVCLCWFPRLLCRWDIRWMVSGVSREHRTETRSAAIPIYSLYRIPSTTRVPNIAKQFRCINSVTKLLYKRFQSRTLLASEVGDSKVEFLFALEVGES